MERIELLAASVGSCEVGQVGIKHGSLTECLRCDLSASTSRAISSSVMRIVPPDMIKYGAQAARTS